MTARYAEGKKVRIVTLIDSLGRPDPQIKQYVDATGTVIKSYCVTRDEILGVEKMFTADDVYCHDIRLDKYDIVLKGIPEVALAPHLSIKR